MTQKKIFRDLRSRAPCVIYARMNEVKRDLVPKSIPERANRRLGRIRFMAHLEKVRKYLEAGYSLIVAYEELQSRLEMSYSQFARYVGQFITHVEKPNIAKDADNPEGCTTTAVVVPVKVEVTSANGPTKPRRPGFTYDNSTPKDKLV
jgi:hypothetical protein